MTPGDVASQRLERRLKGAPTAHQHRTEGAPMPHRQCTSAARKAHRRTSAARTPETLLNRTSIPYSPKTQITTLPNALHGVSRARKEAN
ncbi:hypothetical protein VitviT2T_028268 [Vitis vinifera]|uniref:Uncharacterized protein n=1 Tax=Vitis vinifera TaxID=29760 RepID=A0ABY9DUG8_VITVI|nr:hypothetical protein VitviT2T_028268 [Vitis vinifera]